MAGTEGPYENSHIKYTFSGTLPGNEIWNCSMRTVAAVVTLPILQALTDHAATAFATMWAATGSLLTINPGTVKFNKTTGTYVGTDGKAITIAENTLANAAGTASGQTSPNQISLVASLRTNKAGRSGRGRMYLPMLSPAFSVGTDKLTTGTTGPVANAVAAMIKDINTFSASSFGPFPIAIQSRIQPPTATQVAYVEVGDVADTQRRRRNKVIETYASASAV